MNAAPSVILEDVTLAYRRQPAVHHVSGTFQPGSMTAIVGPNGAGKSTLLKGLMGFLPIREGRIRWRDGSLRDAAYLPQQSDIDHSFPIGVEDLVSMGAWGRAGLFGRLTTADRERIAGAIRAVGLEGFEGRAIGTLSGGQFQRALFARLIVQDAPLLLLDEPFAAVDARTSADLLALMRQWHVEGRTVVAVLHDIELVRRHFPSTLLIARELVGWGETGDVLTSGGLDAARSLSEGWVEDPWSRAAA